MSQYYALTRFLKHQSSRFLFFYLVSFAVLNITLFLSVGKVYSGQATLSWDAPTTNADDTPLTDLAGYYVYYRISSGNYTVPIPKPLGDVSLLCQDVDTDGITECTSSVEVPDVEVPNTVTYCFVVRAYNTSGNPSEYSNEVCKTISSAQQYTLTVTKAGTGNGTISGTTTTGTGINCGSDCTEPYNQGTIVTLTATAATGSAFTGWSGGGCIGTGTCSTTINANTTVTANFNKNIYTYAIAATAGTGGNISPSGTVTVNQGDDKTFTIIPDSGYHIADVRVDKLSVGAVSAYTFSNITASHSIGATFAINTYTITAIAGAGGTITPSGTVTVDHDASQTFTIIPDTGYRIADVMVDGSTVGAVSAYTFNNVTANHSIGATFFALDTSAQEIIIDNGDPVTSYTGAWYVSGGTGPYDTNSLWSREGAYTWTFTPQQTGVYELSMWWTYYVSRSTNIPVDIEYSGGTTRAYINQHQNGSMWNSLGTYLFEAGTSYKVTITAEGSLTTCADAVKFVQKPYNY